MSANPLNQLLATLNVQANVFHNGQYCGAWKIDTSGSSLMNFHIVTHGECLIEVESQRFHLNAGDAVFMPNDAKHTITSLLDSDTKPNQASSLPMIEERLEDATGLVCGHFTHKHPVFNRLLTQLPSIIIIRQNEDTFANAIIELILIESKNSGQNTHFLLNRLSDSLFYILLRDKLSTQAGILAASSHPKLSAPIEFIHNNIEQPLRVEMLANLAGMSRSAFSSLFKETTQLTPAEYVTQWRMTKAYRWLSDDKISTLDAAVRCGYESEASFSKAFKRIIGIGPGEARKIS